LNFNLPLTRNVPNLDMLAQMPVVLFYAGFKGFGQQHVVHHGEAPHTVLLDAVSVGSAPDAARHVEARSGHG
jgi:hypothetical protein